MTVPRIFATHAAGNVPAAYLDEDFAYLNAFAAATIVVTDAVPDNSTDAGPAINVALTTAASGTQGGRVAMLPGIYKVSTQVDIPDNVTFDLGGAALTLAAKITLGANSKLVCNPSAQRTDTTDNTGKITQASGANLAHLIELNGNYGVIDNILVDGAKATNASGGSNVYVTGNRASLFRLTSRNAKTHGIHIFSTGTDDLACCAKILLLMSLRNDGCGIKFENTADCFVSMSEMEENALYAVECDNSPTTRIEHCDLSGSIHGLYVHGASYNPGVSIGSNNQLIVGNQFGNNIGNDVRLIGTNGGTYGNVITGNQFFPSDRRVSNTYSAIYIEDNGPGCNTITGNVIRSYAPHKLKYGVEIYETVGGAESWDTVSSNAFLSEFGTGAFVGTGKTVFVGNVVGDSGDAGVYNISQLSVGTNSASRRAIVYTTTQYDGVEVQGGTGVIAAIYGNNTGNDGGTLGLVYNGVTKVQIGSTLPNFMLDYGLNIGQTTGLTDGLLGLKPQAFSALPAASATYKGVLACVTDSTTAVWGATITGVGGNVVLAYCNGTNWTVMGI